MPLHQGTGPFDEYKMESQLGLFYFHSIRTIEEQQSGKEKGLRAIKVEHW